jgi:hypothetical protein
MAKSHVDTRYKCKRVCLLHLSNYNSFVLQKNQAKGERKSYTHDVYLNKENKQSNDFF